MHDISMHHRDVSSSGSVIFEFLITILVFLFLGVISAELGYTLQARQVIAVIQREAAITAFKECSRINDGTSRQNACLKTYVDTLELTSQAALNCFKINDPNDDGSKPLCPEIVLSIYEVQTPVGGTPSTVRISVWPAGGTTSGGYQSKFSNGDSRFATGGSLKPLMTQNKRVVICEIFWRYRAWLPIARDFLRFNIWGLYDATII